MDGAVLEGRGRSQVADPLNWVTRAKIQSVMDEHYHRCKAAVDQHLNAYYGERQGSVFARAGVTARTTVELFESEACKLIGLLVGNVKPLSHHARAFQMITSMANGFMAYLDLMMGRLGPRIDLEMRNFPKTENSSQSTSEIWAESRARIVECLDRHRKDYALPATAEPDPEAPPEAPMILEQEYVPPVDEADEVVAPGPAAAIEPSASLADWQHMWVEIAVQLCTGKLRPESQGDMHRAMSDWFVARGMEGFEDQADECAWRFWRKFVATQRITSSLGKGDNDDRIEADGSRFDRHGWHSGSQSGVGLAIGASALSRGDAVRCSVAVMPPQIETDGANTAEPVDEDPACAGIRYHVSWSMKRESPLPAPYFDID